MNTLARRAAVLAVLLLPAPALAAGDHAHHGHHAPAAAEPGAAKASVRLVAAELADRKGRPVSFPSALGRDLVVMDFVYTACSTVCVVTSAAMAELGERLRAEGRRGVRLVTMALDPANDTPEELDAFAARFGAGPDWLWLTGPKQTLDPVLKGLGSYAVDFVSHAPQLLVGDPAAGVWRRFTGLPAPERVLAELDALEDQRAAARQAKGRDWFGDRAVIDQHGRTLRLWSDVLDGKTVLINQFFTSCDATCPMVSDKLAEMQEHLGERLGKDVFIVSVSVDPERDTPAAVAAYAARFKPRPGWLFLTGEPEGHKELVRRLGHTAPDPDSHSAALMIGNLPMAVWERVPPNVDARSLAARLLQIADLSKPHAGH